MNKFNALIAGLIVFVAVAQLVAADNDKLASEIAEDDDVDDEPEGGFMSQAKKIVGTNIEDEWGHDILDQDKGMSTFAKERTQQCKEAKKRETCRTCCRGSDQAFQFKMWSQLLKGKGCTCYDRDNSYATRI